MSLIFTRSDCLNPAVIATSPCWQKPSNHFKTLLQFIEQLRVFGSKLVWLSMSGVFARLCCSGRHQRYEKRADEARHIFRTYLR